LQSTFFAERGGNSPQIEGKEDNASLTGPATCGGRGSRAIVGLMGSGLQGEGNPLPRKEDRKKFKGEIPSRHVLKAGRRTKVILKLE